MGKGVFCLVLVQKEVKSFSLSHSLTNQRKEEHDQQQLTAGDC